MVLVLLHLDGDRHLADTACWRRCHASIKSRQTSPIGDERHNKSRSDRRSGRQPQRESARRRSGPSPARRTSPTTRITTASLKGAGRLRRLRALPPYRYSRIAQATVLELRSLRTCRSPTRCLCTASTEWNRVALPLVVLSGHVATGTRALASGAKQASSFPRQAGALRSARQHLRAAVTRAGRG